MDFMIFDSEGDALAADTFISTVGSAPIIGQRVKDGKDQVTKAKTVRWAEPRQRRDGKWVIPRVPASTTAQYPPSVIIAFVTNHPHIIETFDPSWFDTEEA